MTASIDAWVTWLDSEIETAAHAITTETGGSSVCRVHKDGRVTGGLKYQEGRLVALNEVRRLAHRSASTDLAGALDDLEGHWTAELDVRRTAEHASPPWVAYATGGVEAIELATEVLAEND